MNPLRFAVLGHPVTHSLSPAMHRAAFAALGLPHSYEAIDVPDEKALAARIDEVHRGELAGVNITVPHKVAVLSMVAEVDESARKVGAANTLVRSRDRLVLHNTDVAGLADDLRALGLLRLRTACVLGSGGAALAAVVALQRLGASRIALTSRSFTTSEAIRGSSSASKLSALGAELHPFRPGAEGGSFADAAMEADVVVQASSAGMRGIGAGELIADVIPWERLRADAFAYDLVYNPAETPFLRRASERGLRASGGLGMLARQGAHAFSLWLNVTPDIATMRAAANSALYEVSI